MSCPICGTNITQGTKYCSRCGTNLFYMHQRTKFEISERTAFWGGERRFVTALFVKVVGIETLLTRMPVLDIFFFLRKWFAEMEEIVFRFNGTTDTIFTEFRTLCVFGAPKTHLDDASNAVQSALKIREQWEQAKGIPENVYLRFGISSGPVFFGRVQSDVANFTVIGDTVNVASRIEEIAGPGQILISEHTYNQLKGLFETDLIPSLRIRGREALLDIYEVKGIRERSGTKELEEIPLIGRDEEMSQIRAAVESLMARGSRILSIIGEIGTGKTKIKEELIKWIATKRNIQYFEADCISLGNQIPYHSFVRFLKSFFYISDTDSPSAVKEKIEGRLKVLRLDSTDNLEVLVNLLSVSPFENSNALYADPEIFKEKIFSLMRELLNRSSQTTALVVCFEDFHLIDAASTKLLTYLATELIDRPVLFLLLYHPEYTFKLKLRNQDTVRLSGLSLTGIAEYLKHILKADFIKEDLINFINYTTAGNPLLIREIVKFCRFKRAIYKDENVWYFDKSKVEDYIPHSIYEALMASLDTLPERMRVVVDYASVVGQTFNLKVISRLCDLGAIDEEISDLVEMGYFLQTRPGDDPEYVFRNTLLKDVTYNALPLKKRKEIHQKTAQIIETTYRDRLQEFYELLAFHFLRADDFYKAINYYKLAGDKAKALFANDCALFSYSKVNEIMDLLSLRDEKYLELRLETSYNISEIYELIGEYDKMMAEAKSALEIIASRKDPRREAQFRELIGLSYIYLNRLKDAFENLNAALEINKSNNFLDLISSVYVDLGLLNAEEQNYEMAVYYYNLGYRVALDRDDSQATIKCLINLARLHKELGNYQLAIDYLKNALAYAVSHKNRRDEVLVKNYLGEVYLTIGDTNKANRYFKEAFTLASEISFIDMIITASANLSLINALLDNREPLRDWITYIDNRLNLGLSKETEITAELVRIYVILKLGWEDEASEKLRDLIEKCRSFGHKKAEVMSNLLMTQIDRKSINWARNALVLAEDINLPEYLWRSQYAMGQVLMVNGQSEAALDFFRKAYFILDDLKERLRDENLRQSFLSQPEYRHLTEILEEK